MYCDSMKHSVCGIEAHPCDSKMKSKTQTSRDMSSGGTRNVGRQYCVGHGQDTVVRSVEVESGGREIEKGDISWDSGDAGCFQHNARTVSYTHLTLPTILLV